MSSTPIASKVPTETAPEIVPEPVPPKRILRLKSNDGELFKVPEDVAFQSSLIKKMPSHIGITETSDNRASGTFTVSNVDGWTLRKIIDWCQAHRGEVFKPKKEHEDQRVDLTEQDEEYLKVSGIQLKQILDVGLILLSCLKNNFQGASYLEIPGLENILYQKIANLSIGKTIEELRGVYQLPDDLKPNEKEQLAKKFEWYRQ